MKAKTMTCMLLLTVSALVALPGVAADAPEDLTTNEEPTDAVDIAWPCYLIKVQTYSHTIIVYGVGSVTVYGRTVCI